MSLRSATAFAFIATTVLTIFLAAGFIRDLLAFARDVVPALAVLTSLVHLLAALSLAVFFYVFQRSNRV